ncbi:hypothetical protein CMV_014354 [Castanea mollissima]|uniref:Uncharacterized protein n=1 Tax=Castanea mollissima TaxID=60419 RepID=A0A8J4QYH5_9ROSI|nr:hypothetical protein CMV_014354 [Castanea mollissima]
MAVVALILFEGVNDAKRENVKAMYGYVVVPIWVWVCDCFDLFQFEYGNCGPEPGGGDNRRDRFRREHPALSDSAPQRLNQVWNHRRHSASSSRCSFSRQEMLKERLKCHTDVPDIWNLLSVSPFQRKFNLKE